MSSNGQGMNQQQAMSQYQDDPSSVEGFGQNIKRRRRYASGSGHTPSTAATPTDQHVTFTADTFKQQMDDLYFSDDDGKDVGGAPDGEEKDREREEKDREREEKDREREEKEREREEKDREREEKDRERKNIAVYPIGTFYGLPMEVKDCLKEYRGIDTLYEWQDSCLSLPGVFASNNLIYSLPTSGGKTLVAEILILQQLLIKKKDVIFILPFVAIVQEKVKELGPFGQSFNFGIEEYAASKGRLPPVRKRNDKRVVYVATIEKANGLVNSLIESNRLSSIGLIVIDELHMISDRSRGSVLEMCLIKVLLGATNYPDGIQMVGMSATISNVSSLAQFLRAQVYTNNFRPVELKEYVKLDHNIYSIDTMASIRKIQPHVNKVDPDQVSVLVSEIIPQSSCLIFCQSKKNCESVALMLTQCLPQSLMRGKYNERKSLLDVMRIETSYMCPILAKTIPYGIAYHHSGLTGDERSLIEGAYLDGTLCVITCTSTLAAGVNLPARRVIIRSPYVGRDFITVSQYRQMAGRAGRCGLCDAGDSIIIVNNKDKQKFIDVISRPPDSCNSQLLSDDRLMSLILSLIALQLLKTASDDDISKLVECSLLSYTQSVDVVELKQKCLDALHHLLLSNYIIMTSSNLMITDLGRAIHKGLINASMGCTVYGELCNALKQLIVINDLHLLYLCVPPHVVESIIPNWKTFFHQFSALSSDELKVAELYNIKMDVLINKYNGRTVKLSDGDNMIYIRMYVALMLHSIIKCTDSRGVWSVADRFDCPRGTMQSITLQCCTYASCLVHFTQELDVLWPLNALLPMIVRKLSHCVSIDLLPLMEIPGIKQGRARQLFKLNIKSPQDVIKYTARELAETVEHLYLRQAAKLISGAKQLLADKAEELRDEAQELIDGLAMPPTHN